MVNTMLISCPNPVLGLFGVQYKLCFKKAHEKKNNKKAHDSLCIDMIPHSGLFNLSDDDENPSSKGEKKKKKGKKKDKDDWLARKKAALLGDDGDDDGEVTTEANKYNFIFYCIFCF